MTNDMEGFYTRGKANEGKDFPLYLPTGEKSQHSIKIRGVDSDEFRRANITGQRDLARAEGGDPELIVEIYRENRLKLIASLVISWTFPQECTTANIIQFLREAPQIADAIDTAASKRTLFFGKESRLSSSLQKQSSDSVKSQEVRSKPSGKASSKSTKPRKSSPRS